MLAMRGLGWFKREKISALLNRFRYLTIPTVLLAGYCVSVVCLDDIKLIHGNVTPVVNPLALWGLVAVGLVAAILLIKNAPDAFNFFTEEGAGAKRRDVYLLLIILTLFRLFAFLLSPDFIQFMRVWPDSTGYLSDMQTVLQDPVRIFDRKSPVYTIWLVSNHLIFGKIIGLQSSDTYFGVTVFLKDIVPPIFFQNVIGVLTALICFSIFSPINVHLAYAVTLLTFLNPTTLATENSILRESLVLFFVLGGFALFLKANVHGSSMYSIISGVLLFIAYQIRAELIIIYALLCLALFAHAIGQKQRMWKTVILFCLPMILSVLFAGYTMSYKSVESSYSGRFGLALFGLKSKCYFYESPTFPELIESIQKRTIQCENERGAPCDDPATTIFVLRSYMDEEIGKYLQSRNLQTPIKEIHDQIFLDIVRNNPLCYIQSVLTNIGYNLIHNVQNITPILFDGDKYLISQNWNYYASPKMLVFYEKDTASYKYIVCLFRTIELYTTRKILFPFFFIGSIIILISTRRRFFANCSDNSLLMASILLISWVHLLFLSVMADLVARFVYPILPFIFAIEIIGVIGVYHWFKARFLNR
ncbi:MAG: hypothetical protein Q6359_00265 [Candidatus Brocadiales bacterium]|nr:hypothetical protein [Candidatus Brocadiales bacterium]